jgi:hypothetical protein
VAVGDFNSDGRLDLATSNRYSNDVSVLLGNGDATFQTTVNYPAGNTPAFIAVADLNQDGKLDLAATDQYGNNVSLLFGIGDGRFQSAVSYATGAQPVSLTSADFNGDGATDLAVATAQINSVGVLLGNGVCTRWTANASGYLAIWGDGTLDVSGATVDPAAGAITATPSGFDTRRPSSIWIANGVDQYLFTIAEGLQAYHRNGALAYNAAGAWGCCDNSFDPLIIDSAGGFGYKVQDGIAFHYDLTTGTRLSNINSFPFPGHLALANATDGFVSSSQGHVTRYDIGNNTVVWDVALSAPGAAAPSLGDLAIGADSTVYVSSTGTLLAAIAPGGTIAWQRNDVAPQTWPILDGAGHLYIGTATTLDAYDATNGSSVWRVPVGAAVNDLAVGDRGLIWAIAGSQVIGVSIGSGAIVSAVAAPANASQLLLRGGSLYVGGPGAATAAIAVPSTGYDPTSPWPVRWHDNQRTTNRSAPLSF